MAWLWTGRAERGWIAFFCLLVLVHPSRLFVVVYLLQLLLPTRTPVTFQSSVRPALYKQKVTRLKDTREKGRRNKKRKRKQALCSWRLYWNIYKPAGRNCNKFKIVTYHIQALLETRLIWSRCIVTISETPQWSCIHCAEVTSLKRFQSNNVFISC